MKSAFKVARVGLNSIGFAMTIQAVVSSERRIAPRFQTSFCAELASGTVLVPVTVRDLSITGCGVVIRSGDMDLPDKLDARGLLHLPSTQPGTYGTILPVTLRNVRSESHEVIYGLEFTRLLPHQTRKLIGVLEAMCQPE